MSDCPAVEILVNTQPKLCITPINPNNKGEKGADGVGALETFTVGQTIIQPFKVVTTNSLGKAIYASADNPEHANKVIGISLESKALDAIIKVQRFGKVYNALWDWTPLQQLYLGLNGEITANPSPTNVVIYLGYAITSKEINLEIDQNLVRWSGLDW
jgi:hypothetical protein